MMNEKVKLQLEQEDITKWHQAILTRCNDNVQRSRDTMSSYYSRWDKNDEVFRGYRLPDSEDKKAEKRGEPIKMTVPLTFPQVMSYISFAFQQYYQRPYFYELIGTGPEDYKAAKIGEALLHRDLNFNKFTLRLFQYLLDIGRFGVGALKFGWTEKSRLQKVVKEIPPASFLGLSLGRMKTEEVVERVPYYKGNEIRSISPYRIFPDTRVPLSQFQEGEFCACEDEYTYITLKKMEQRGEVAGVSFIPAVTAQDYNQRKSNRFQYVEPVTKGITVGQHKSSIIITEVQMDVIPKEMVVEGEETLGQEDYPVKYLVWVANDKRVIRFEEMGYDHDGFTYEIFQFLPDMHKFVNESICDFTGPMVDTANWFVNSHITNVRKVIQNQLLIDPSAIEMAGLKERSPYLFLKKSAARTGVDKYIKQLEVRDVTSGHMSDVQALEAVIQLVTGISDNASGQYHSGRRSATEARAVNMAAAGRLKLVCKLIWDGSLQTLGEKLLSNLRQGLDIETTVRILGGGVTPEGLIGFHKVTGKDLEGTYDFEVFDGTLPTEKSSLADSYMEVLKLVATQFGPMIGLDPRQLIIEIAELRGARNVDKLFPLGGMNGTGVNQGQGVMGQAPGAPAVGVTPRMAGPSGNGILQALTNGAMAGNGEALT